jgi:hypothetical protein
VAAPPPAPTVTLEDVVRCDIVRPLGDAVRRSSRCSLSTAVSSRLAPLVAVFVEGRRGFFQTVSKGMGGGCGGLGWDCKKHSKVRGLAPG